MKTTMAIYTNHEEALNAVKHLKENGFTNKQLSLIWNAKDEKAELEKFSEKVTKIEAAEIGVGVTMGSILGVLTGIGVFAIPGLGILYGAGAIVGAIAGFDLGLIGGGIISALSIAGMKEVHHKYDTHLKEGNYLLMVQGSDEEANKAKNILQNKGGHTEVNIH